MKIVNGFFCANRAQEREVQQQRRAENRGRHQAYLAARHEAAAILINGGSLPYRSGQEGGFFTLPTGETVSALRLLQRVLGVNVSWLQLVNSLEERDDYDGGIFFLYPPPAIRLPRRASVVEKEMAAY